MSDNPTGENPLNLPSADMVEGEYELDGMKLTLLNPKGHEEEIIQICLAQDIGEPCGYCTLPFKDAVDVMKSIWGGANIGWVHPACYEKIKEGTRAKKEA